MHVFILTPRPHPLFPHHIFISQEHIVAKMHVEILSNEFYGYEVHEFLFVFDEKTDVNDTADLESYCFTKINDTVAKNLKMPTNFPCDSQMVLADNDTWHVVKNHTESTFFEKLCEFRKRVREITQIKYKDDGLKKFLTSGGLIFRIVLYVKCNQYMFHPPKETGFQINSRTDEFMDKIERYHRSKACESFQMKQHGLRVSYDVFSYIK